MRLLPALIVVAALAGCQTTTAPAPVAATNDAHDVSYAIADAMKKCWFSGDAAFTHYVYAPEVVGGNPRILIVPKSEPGGLPALVIEPKTRAVVDLYGPLMTSPLGPRISGDIGRWKSGQTNCA